MTKKTLSLCLASNADNFIGFWHVEKSQLCLGVDENISTIKIVGCSYGNLNRVNTTCMSFKCNVGLVAIILAVPFMCMLCMLMLKVSVI